MRYLLGVDFGGGSSKATLIDEEGHIITTAAEEYPMLYPHVGWAEQDLEALYQAFLTNIRNVLAKSRVDAKDIAAMSIDGATHIGVLLDEKNEVIRPAIHWTDSRSAEEAAQLAPLKERFIELCYNAPTPTWTLPQIMWLKNHEPEAHARIAKVIYLKDYIRYRVTGKLASDFIEVEGALFYDETKQDWCDDFLAIADLTRDQMPELHEPAEIAGTLLPAFCKESGLSPDTIVAYGATDTVMEIFAAGAANVGDTTIKLATAGRICPITDKAYPDPQLFCYRHVIPGYWYPGTGTKTCAQAMRWYRDTLGAHEMEQAKMGTMNAFELISEAAAKVPAGSEKLFFHPYLQGELTPYQNTRLRASFTGVGSYHTKAHFDRALMEGVAYSLRDCMGVFARLGIKTADRFRIIGGGSKSPIWRQIVSDVLDMPLQRVTSDDSSIGSAMLAGVAAGVFPSFAAAVEACSQLAETVEPDERNRKVYDEGFEIYKEIQQAMENVYNKYY